MSVKIYVEGGGRYESTLEKCRSAFSAYCAKIVPNGRRYRVVACGSRAEAYKKFKTAVKDGRATDIYALLVDAEGPVTAATPADYLARSEGWSFVKSQQNRVFLMVQAMESWFLADREALAAFYGAGFVMKNLPGTASAIESIPKADLELKLNHAARLTSKGEYHKTKHGFALLALIDPRKVQEASPHAASFHQFLREQLQ